MDKKYPSSGPIKMTMNLDPVRKYPGLKPVRLQASDGLTPPDSIPADMRDGLVPYQFRILSASYLMDYSIDYSTPGVLEGAIERKLLDGNAVMINHSLDVRDWVGVCGRYWMAAADGDLPAGINAELWIDKNKSNGRVDGNDIIRGVDMGAIHSCSLTISFDWKRSHPDMPYYAFWEQLGTKINGEIVRLIVTNINEFMELSLVWRGADRNARRIKPGTSIQNAAFFEIDNYHTEGGEPMRNILAAKLKKPVEEIGETTINGFIDEALTAAAQAAVAPLQATLAERDAKIAQLDAQIATLTQEKSGLASLAKAGEEYLVSLRKETSKIYKLAVGDKADDATTRMIESTTDIAQLKAWQSLYAPLADKAMGELHCAACGSNNLTRQQSETPPVPGGGEGATAQSQQTVAIASFTTSYFGAEKK